MKMFFNHGIHRIYGMVVSLILLLLVRSSFAAIWYVDAAKGNDENSGASWDSALVTIQKAIDISSDGDTVVVGDGIYDSIDAKNKRIIIRSKNGFKSTVIDGRKTSRCFVGGGGSLSSKPCTTLEGFTLCNGNAQAGLNTMGGASVGGLLVNCFLQNNNAHYNAGAAWYSEMENCLITGSTVDSNGGAYCTVVYQCTLRNCTIVNNRCSRGTSVAYGSNLYNCIVYDNSPNAIQVTQQEVKNCYTSDPLFVDVDSGDYRLKKASPCIDAGSNSYSSTVADLAGKARIYNGTVDIGAYEYSPNVFSISSVTAAQRYPWNGLVDLKFTITGESGTKYDTSFTAKDMVGGTNIAMKTIRKSDGTTAAEKEKLLPGTYNWVWDAAADLPKDFKCERMTVTGTAEQSQGLYMVIDLSSGPNSSKYPVSYLDAVPTGGWSDEYKTTKLVLRRIEAGSFKMQGEYNVTLTKPFYMGVFEVTQKQYLLVTGNNPVPVNNKWCYGEKCPIFFVSYSTIRGSNKGGQWPSSSDVDPSSFLGRLQVRTSMKFDLPTEAQWEYACRAGTNSVYYWGDSMNGDYCWWSDNCDRAQVVGLKSPNGWGLYDMAGNAWEFCLDWYGNLSYGTDPKGAMSNSLSRRVRRGGDWQTSDEDVLKPISSYSRDYDSSSWSGDDDGFRLCLTLSN